MYGALADLLSGEAERTDVGRATYCMQRYTQGLEVMRQSNWLVQAGVNNVPVDPVAVFEKDSYDPGWEESAVFPCVVQAGQDFFGVAGLSSGDAVNMTLVGNAPLPEDPDDYVQIPRDQWEVVLGMAQRTACFKVGGAEFDATLPLEQEFYKAAQEVNKRLLTYGVFVDTLHSEGERQDAVQPR